MVRVTFNNLNGNFNPNRPTYMITHGFADNSQSGWVSALANDLIQRDPNNPNDNVNANVISVDWSDGSQFALYSSAVNATVSVGNQIANYLINVGANPNTTQLIGHSLGAHISGIAGARYKALTRRAIGTIVGLDSAGPSYEPLGLISGMPTSKRLDATDANRVIAFHTTSSLGYDGRLANLDIYVNWNDLLQPGQLTPIGGHSYAYQLYGQLLEGYYFVQSKTGSAGRQFDLFDVNNKNLTGSIYVDTYTVSTKYGTAGNDTFNINSLGERVAERVNNGIDKVISTVNYTLGANIENLTLIGNARNGVGNNLNNTLVGNAANNVLNGGAGNDVINGLAGNDTINGSVGNDLMYGSFGNDTFYVNSAGDRVFEGLNRGKDRVISTVNHALGANVENLTLIGNARNGVGNILNNTLVGNAFNNILNGAGGNDRMSGAAGNDTYYIDSFGDRVFEGVNKGIDRVISRVNHTLGANVENLTLIGNARNGVGNILNNTLVGNAFNNVLNGGAGNDLLNGGAGADRLIGGAGRDVLVGGIGGDRFVFNSISERIDIISDFNRIQGDKIVINRRGFGATSTNQFRLTASGALLFRQQQIATLQNVNAFNVATDIVLA